MDTEENSASTRIRKRLSNLVKAEKGSSEHDRIHWLLRLELEGTSTIQLNGQWDFEEGGGLESLPDEEVTALVEVLQDADVCRLEKLDLSHNRLAERNIVALFKVLKTGRFSSLTHLDLSKTSYDVEMKSTKAIAAALKTGLLSGLLHLSLPPCHVPTIAEAMRLGGVSNLEHLNLEGHRELEQRSRELTEVFQTGMLSYVVHLSLWNCSLEADAMEALARAIESNEICKLKHLDLSWNPIRERGSVAIAGLLRSGFLSHLAFLSLWRCEIRDGGMSAISAAIVDGLASGIRVLNVEENTIGDAGTVELLKALRSHHLPELQTLIVSMNSIHEGGMVALAQFLEEGRHVGGLKELHLLESNVSERSARAFVTAYANNEALTVELKKFRWPNRYFETIADRYRKRNVAVTSARNNLREEKDVPATTGKVFLCGFQRVGKTTLRKSLQQTKLGAVYSWSAKPEPRTRGIEVSRITKKGRKGQSKVVLSIWDLAGQAEYRVLQSAFCLAEGKATIFVIVCNAVYLKPESERELLFWLRFVASSCEQGIQRHVLVVLNCFGGHECSTKPLWNILIQNEKQRFQDLLHIYQYPFVLDARKRSSVAGLKNHLLTLSQTLLENHYMPGICQYIPKYLRKWKMRNQNCPVLPLEEFLSKFQNMRSEQDKERLLAALRFLHEEGNLVFFSKDMLKMYNSDVSVSGLVVLDPNWFCQRVVGELLLPDCFLEQGQSVRSIAEADGSILLEKLHAFLKLVLGSPEQVKWVVAMLMSLGLCYQAKRDEVLVPALIQGDDMDKWEKCGIKDEAAGQWVMGRSFTLLDHEKTALPAALFRRLQVALAQDRNFGMDSYTASKTSSTFKYGRMIVLIQFDVNENDPEDDRIDILVKPLGLITDDPAHVRKQQLDLIEDIMYKLEPISICCCPGVQFDRNVIIPWNAAKPTLSMKDRELVTVEKVKEHVQKHGLGSDSNWCVDGSCFVLFDDLLSAKDLEGLEVTISRQCKGLEEGALFLRIDLNDTHDTLDGIREGFVEEIPSGLLSPEGNYIVNKIVNLGEIVRKEVRLQGRLTRNHVNGKVAELQGSIKNIFDKQNVLLRKVQAFQSYTIAEKESSSPRFLYVTKSSDSGAWITVKKAFVTPFRIHLLCEARVDDGYMHEVQGQEGVEINYPKKWLRKLQPWLEWSLAIAIIVARAVGGAALPGVNLLLPNLSCSEGANIALLAESAATLGEAALKNGVSYASGPGSSSQTPVHLKERAMAAALLKDLIEEVGRVEFWQKIGLRRAVLRDRDGTPGKCAWICDACYNGYNKRGALEADISP